MQYPLVPSCKVSHGNIPTYCCIHWYILAKYPIQIMYAYLLQYPLVPSCKVSHSNLPTYYSIQWYLLEKYPMQTYLLIIESTGIFL
jgi:hypothetical protein